MTTGMRHGELLSLRWDDIDFEAGTLKIHRNVAYVPHHSFIAGPPKTESGNRMTLLPQFVLRALRKHQEFQALQKEFIPLILKESGMTHICRRMGVHMLNTLTNIAS